MDRTTLPRRSVLAGALALGVMPRAARAAPFASTRLTVTVRGTGPDVVLIHGVNSSRNIWANTLPAFAGNRAHLVQIAGFAGVPAGGNAHGSIVASLAAELARYIVEAKLERPAIIGHSMGGTIGLMLAARWPARVGRLMVVDMLPAPAGLLGGTAAGLGPLAQGLQRLFSTTPQGRDGFANLMRMFAPPGSNSDPDVIGRTLAELAAIDLTADLPKITAPATIVYATPPPGETLTPAQVRQSYVTAYRSLKGAKLVAIPDSGHMVMLDQPARFNVAVDVFLAR
jgi:N-formylmaleamate deformylase